ncbi:muconate cycloisomerase family protein [Rouxiella badensis]|jgi:muconate cycloisomerase|uniref:Muconate cycloisomerase n=2 Tax=Rouxiella badensis TaxID=1646377 RepID=A0A1X0WH00_9GAMM|nr:muconate cycloisomerase family protein [Rouxiella badensis]MCC3718080.1 muconate cycloisomerase family protein [Rouxiella badensis]MCC3727152.1 muconate cycloisomerase family protein [Rouxiella badensis]MCC3731564.1 muconate cycloisomerase family protein [Rouxiella badensis]MCC3738499.1 muconate cycloisomerase family protein [Rouxiella badensis]MCC3756953.1 muconate cycloisomerase family protein [Rouxiella badensis]
MSLTINAIECWLVDIPTIRPHKLSMVTMGCQTLTLVKMSCSGGVVGWGEATTIGGLSYGPESPEAIKSAIDHYLAPLLCHQPFTGVEALSRKMNSVVKGNTFAKSALETAFLDAQGKTLNVPVSELLGGRLTDELPVLWTLASGSTEKDIDEGHRLIAEGRHRAFKLKIGANALQTDLKHALAIKAALGENIPVHVDVNQAWDMTTALLAIPQLFKGGITMIEQPIPLHDQRNLIALSQRVEATLLADEAVPDYHCGFSLASGGFTGAFALKIAKAGGPAQVIKLARVAQAAGISLYGGTMLEGTLGTVSSLHAWSTLEMKSGTEMFGPLLLKDDIVVQSLEYRNGHVVIPSGPGLGVEIDTDKLKHYSRNE